MKALTISQPWASLIARGEKFIENRCWPTNYRGDLAIHAGKGGQYLSRAELAEYTTGAVVAVARLVACVSMEELRHAAANGQPSDRMLRDGIGPERCRQILEHEYTEGPYCWVLENVRHINPVLCSGKQGLWECVVVA